MTEQSELEQRLNDLEAHIAHQDSIIQDLNDVSLELWDEIKTLKEQAKFLKGKLEAIEDANEEDAGEEPPPPHY